jgi:DNA-binding NarL/FixJ family response regulator
LKFRFFNDEWELFLAHCGFSDDELEIITFLRREWSFADIAAELSISYSTLTRRRKRIYQKIARYISNSPH